MSWHLDQTDPYAYTLHDTSGATIAEINFYDTEDANDPNMHRIARLAAAAPDLRDACVKYVRYGDDQAIYAILRQLGVSDQPDWGTR